MGGCFTWSLDQVGINRRFLLLFFISSISKYRMMVFVCKISFGRTCWEIKGERMLRHQGSRIVRTYFLASVIRG